MPGMLAFLLCAVGARFISERAMRALPAEQKVLLVDAFSNARIYGLLMAIVIGAAVFLLPRAFPDEPRTGMYIGLLLFVGWGIGRQVMTARRLRALKVDADYRRKVFTAQLVMNAGVLCLLASVMVTTSAE